MSPLRTVHAHEITRWRDLARDVARWLAVLLLLLLFLHTHGWAQGIKPTGQNVQHVICDSGCSGSSATAFGIQVRNAGDTAWVNVGFNVANLSLPVVLQTGAAVIGSIANTGFNVNNFPTGFNVNNFPATQAVSEADGANVTQGAKADARSTATDTTAITLMQVLKEISFMEQNPVSRPVTQNTSPWITGITQWAGSTLGAMANYGTSPGAVLVPGVNAFITNFPTSFQVSNFPATQAVTQSTSPWVVSCTTANCTVNLGQVNGTPPSEAAGDPAGTENRLSVNATPKAAQLAVTAVSAANVAVTATLPAAGANLFHYITAIRIVRTCTTAITGSAALTVTTTNLPGSLAWTMGNACAVGSTNNDVVEVFEQPLKSSAANTASTIVCPAIGATGLCRVNVYYYTGT